MFEFLERTRLPARQSNSGTNEGARHHAQRYNVRKGYAVEILGGNQFIACRVFDFTIIFVHTRGSLIVSHRVWELAFPS